MVRRVVVVAHPDDEILWLSSVLAKADSVILCFGAPYGRPEKAKGRACAVAHLALPGLESLDIPESGARLLVDWKNPTLTETGIKINDSAAQMRYDSNFVVLLEKLCPILAGATDVYTHNPWGEYGHSEHIQVHRAVKTLQAALRFNLWFSNYAAPQTRNFAWQEGQKALWQQKQILPTDIKCAHRLRGIYQKYNAWTWSNWHKWPQTETLYAQPHGAPERWYDMRGEFLYNARGLRVGRPVWTAKWRLS